MSYEHLPNRKPLDYVMGKLEPIKAPSRRTGRFVVTMLIVAALGIAALYSAAVCVGCAP